MSKHKMRKCPTCENDRVAFTIKKRMCPVCRMDKKRADRTDLVQVTWDDIRAKRKKLLAETDYWDNYSYRARLEDDQNLKHDNYRNVLRDITKSCDNAADVVFPTKPK